MRHGHWLRRNPETTIPNRHIILATELAELAGDGRKQVMRDCHAIHAHWLGTRLVSDKVELMPGMSCVWRDLSTYCDLAGVTWIWLTCPREDLPATGFTREVEAGYFQRKYWVFADPPVILNGTLYGKKVKILGVQNWDEFWQPIGKTAADKAYATLHAVEGILGLVQREDLGHLRTTVAGQSFQAYRHLHLNGKIGIHSSKPALKLERDCPLAPPVRQQVRGRVGGPIYVLDVNGLYPYVQGAYPYPRHLHWREENVSVAELRRASAYELVIARVSGYAAGEGFLVKRKDGAVWTNTLCDDVLLGPDLQRALVRNQIGSCSEATCYEPAGIFVSWSDWALRLRERYRHDNCKTSSRIAKALGTRMWSQFTQRLERWVSYDDGPPAPSPYCEFWHHTLEGIDVRCRTIAGVTDKLECLEEPNDSFPAISSFVAAYARQVIHQYCEVAGWHNVLYTVADAIHVNHEGYKRLANFGAVDGTRPGALKLSQEVASAVYLKPNVHVLDGKLTQAGLPVGKATDNGHYWTWLSPLALSTSIFDPPDGTVTVQAFNCSTPAEPESEPLPA